MPRTAHYATLLSLLLAAAPLAAAEEGSLLDSICRLKREGGIGSGAVIARDGANLFVLTNAHVAGPRGSAVRVEFWHRGHHSRPLAGVTVRSVLDAEQSIDVAIVWIPARALGPVLPPPLRLALMEEPVAAGTVLTAGCAEGRWPSCVQGRIVAGNNSAVLHFVPQPAAGRSGSPLVDGRGTIVGLVAWRSDAGSSDAASAAEGHGLAIPHTRLWPALHAASQYEAKTTTNNRFLTAAPGPSSHCVHGVPLTAPCRECQMCSPEGCFPFGRGKPEAAPGPANPWPSLPDDLLAPRLGENLQDYVRRTEFDSARRAFEDAVLRLDRRLAELAGDAATERTSLQRSLEAKQQQQQAEIANLEGEVQSHGRTLREALRQVLTSEEAVRLREDLRSDFLARLEQSAESQAGLVERVKTAAAGLVEDRLAELRSGNANSNPLGEGVLVWILGIALPLLGIGGWQAWIITRLAQRASTHVRGESDDSLLARLVERLGDRLAERRSGAS